MKRREEKTWTVSVGFSHRLVQSLVSESHCVLSAARGARLLPVRARLKLRLYQYICFSSQAQRDFGGSKRFSVVKAENGEMLKDGAVR